MIKISNRTAVQQVIEVIMLGIQQGTFKIGEKIPSQRKLSDLFGVSRTVVREAIKVLEGQGILISKVNSGTYIKHELELNKSKSDENGKYDLDDIIEMSNVIWLASISLIDEVKNKGELNQLYNKINKFHKEYSSKTTNQEKFIYETSFGTNLTKLTNNKLISELMIELLKATSEIDLQLIINNNNYKQILEIDKKILESILNSDKVRACFWGKERNIIINKITNSISPTMDKKYTININSTQACQ